MRLPLLALLALLLPAAPAAAVDRSAIGVQVSSIRGAIAQSDIDRDLNRAKALGLRMVRVEVTWDALERTGPGRIDAGTLDGVDRFFRGAAARGIKVMLTVDGTPCWASSAPAPLRGDCSGDRLEASRYPPSDPQSFVGISTFLVKRYAAQLKAFELWNEPDQRNELYWAGPDKVTRYAALARAVYGPLKAAAPNVPVVAGAFVGTDGRWLQALYDAGFKGTYDMLSVHFYDLTLFAIRNIRAVQRRNGDAKPLWLGETGWSSCIDRGATQDGHQCVGRGAQGRFTTDLVRSLRRAPYVRGMSFYTMTDLKDYDFGMFDSSGRMKASGRALRQELRRRSTRSPRALRLSVRRSGGALAVVGSASAGEVYTVEVRQRGFLRFRGFVRLGPDGRYRTTLPAELGTRGLTVTVRSPFLGRRVTRRV